MGYLADFWLDKKRDSKLMDLEIAVTKKYIILCIANF